MVQKAQLQGSGDGTAVPAGYVGSDQIAFSNSFANAGTTGTWWDAGSINFTGKPGKYLVNGTIEIIRNSATFTKLEIGLGFSTTTGNSSSGILIPQTASEFEADLFTTNWQWQAAHTPTCIVVVGTSGVVSINGYATSGNTLYLKALISNCTGGTPLFRYVMSAIMVA